MFKKTPLASAIGTIVFAGSFAAGAGVAVPAYAATDASSSSQPMEEVVVTGSRIKRTSNTQSKEVITFTAEDMQMGGKISVADALRSSNLNTIGSFREASGYSAQSNAELDLRGMGPERTLVLVNGRRVVGSPSLGGGGTVNLNLIPFSAVDRVEVLPDGASAVYGSDAIAGVVNVILKKNYKGMHVSARLGNQTEDGGKQESLSMLMGASDDRARITVGLEYDHTPAIFDTGRPYTSPKYADTNGDGHVSGYVETVGVSYYGYTLKNPNYNPALYDPNDQTSTYGYFNPGANCTVGNGFVGPIFADDVFGPGTGYYCGYAYGAIEANRASLSRINSWVSTEYDVTDKITAYADTILAHNQSFGRYAPAAAPGPVIPGDPRNTIGATYGYFRWTQLGPRDNHVDDQFTDINIGVKGDMGNGTSWDAHYTLSKYTSANVGSYYLSYAGLTYNITYGVTDPAQYVANMKSTTLNDDRQQMQKFTADVQFNMFSLPGGKATAYLRAEYFKIDYQALVDGQSEAGLVGGSAGNSAAGKRQVHALSAEAIFPIQTWFEVDAALRHDNYSDFGSATSPRIGVTMWIPGFEQLKLKASWGKGFRAPDLSTLYGVTAFSAEAATDNYGCQLSGLSPCPSKQFSTYIGSNPNLDAEKSDSWTVGASYTFMGNWTASVDYIDLTLKNSIDYTSAQDQLDIDYNTGGNNPNVVRGGTGIVTAIYAGYQNGSVKYGRKAVDMGLTGSYDTNFGTFGLNFKASHYLHFDAETSYGTGILYNSAGTLGFPSWRSSAQVTWSMNNWFASINSQFIGQSKARIGTDAYPSWTQTNITGGYNFDKYGKVTVGADNVSNRFPVLNAAGGMADEFLYPNIGRVVFVQYSVDL